jgi:hypothetical protein
MTAIEWLTSALVLITAVYSFATFRILRANEAVVAAMRKQQRDQARPDVQVTITLRLGTQLFYLSIKNIGRTPARYLRLVLNKPIHPLAGKQNLQEISAFSEPIDSLPPGAELLFIIGIGQQFSADNSNPLLPSTFEVTATYAFDDEEVTEPTAIDLRPYLNSAIPQHPIVEELARLRKSVDDLPGRLETSR